jgi:acetyltransferase-like isoleucine patch superfamily enzyme
MHRYFEKGVSELITRQAVDAQEERLFQAIPRLSKHLAPLADRGLQLEIGRYSYGTPRVYFQGDRGRRLVIGNFVSIGPDVKIFCGRQGSHPLDLLSSFPMGMLYPDWAGGTADTTSRVFTRNLDITIGNDVWIGANAVILAGAAIGHGSVIAAGGVVNSSIPPYTLAGGVPARPIRLRFAPDVVKRLLELAWWDLPIETLLGNLPALFYEPNCRRFLAVLERIRDDKSTIAPSECSRSELRTSDYAYGGERPRYPAP